MVLSLRQPSFAFNDINAISYHQKQTFLTGLMIYSSLMPKKKESKLK